MKVLILTFILIFSGCANSETIKDPEDISMISSGKDLHFNGLEFKEDIDLTSILEFTESAPGVLQARINGNIIFEDCRFGGFSGFSEKETNQYTVVFEKNLIFRNCSFEKDVDLSYSEIGGTFSLENSSINGSLFLRNSWFKGKYNNFESLKVSDQVKITGSIFENNASFFQAEFYMPVILQKSVFRGSADFRASNFYNHAVFGRAVFHSDLIFSEAAFTLNVDLSRVKVWGNLELYNSSFKGKTDLSDAIFYGHINPDGAEFENSPRTEDTYFLIEKGLFN